jgi:hypothetical protein
MDDKKIAAGSTITGGAIGAATNLTMGGVGLAGGGTAIGLGLASMTGIGAVVGLAAFGAYKVFKDTDKKDS